MFSAIPFRLVYIVCLRVYVWIHSQWHQHDLQWMWDDRLIGFYNRLGTRPLPIAESASVSWHTRCQAQVYII